MKRRFACAFASLAAAYACSSDPESDGPGGSSGRGGTDQGGQAGMGAGTSGGTAGNAGGSAGSGATTGGRGGTASGTSGSGGAPGGEGGGEDGAGSGGEGGASTPDAITVPPVVSGSRLRARVLSGSDGSRHLIGLHDTELDIHCDFANLGAGGFRCAPLADRAVTSGVFMDDQCQVPGAGYETACGALRYSAASTAGRTCDGLTRLDVSSMGANYPGAFGDSDSCAPYADGNPGMEWHATSPVAPSTFVEGALERRELGGGLSLLSVVGADGSRQARSFWFDGRPCTAVDLANGGRRCAPGPTLNLFTFFADASCTTEVGYMQGGNTACGDPPFLPIRRPVQLNGCTVQTTALAEVTRFTGSTAYRGQPCTSLMLPQSPIERWVVDAPVAPSVLPELARVLPGTQRLRTTAARTANGSVIELSTTFAIPLFDAVLGETCTPKRFADGVVRCTPSGAAVGFYYADPECTVPVLPTPSHCLTTRFALDERPHENGCSEEYVVAAVYQLGEPGAGSVYERVSDTNQNCVEGNLPEGFITLEPIASSELVTLVEVLE